MQIKEKIKNKLLNFYSNKNLKQSNAEKDFLDFSFSRNIGIIFCSKPEFFKYVEAFKAELCKYNKKVKIISYFKGLKKTFQEKNYPFFLFDEIKLTGKISSIHLQEFMDINFDYLFVMEFEFSPELGYIISKCKGKCKIGYYSPQFSPFLDLMLNFTRKNNEDDMKELTNLMLKYCKII